MQALRDYLDSSIEEVLVDDDEVFEKAEAYMHASMPRGKTRLVRYTERMPLFSRFAVEPQIDRIYARTVALPGGGSIVIDATEALTAIDVNSGKASAAPPRRRASTPSTSRPPARSRANCACATSVGSSLWTSSTCARKSTSARSRGRSGRR